ncbi:MAG: CPBP family intramembrane metalloprotease [Armatimonadota bacterium]|nr:MAG: CPBP family intramembrane metalloprotease [Armatimonadota bacterium]
MTSDMAQSERTRIGWHPITLGLVLVVGLSVMRAGGAAVMRKLWGDIDFEPSLRGALFLLVVFVLGSVGLIGGGLFGLAGVSWERLGWRRDRLGWEILRGLLAVVVLGVIAAMFAVVAGRFLGLKPPPTDATQPGFTLVSIAMSVLFGFFIASWQEECLFRGYLQPLFIERWGLWPGMLTQAALFSVAHIGWAPSWPYFVLFFVIGIVFGWLRGRDGSLVAPFVAHGLVG